MKCTPPRKRREKPTLLKEKVIIYFETSDGMIDRTFIGEDAMFNAFKFHKSCKAGFKKEKPR